MLLLWRDLLPVFDYPLYDGIGGEAVPAVHDPQDSSPPGLLDVNKTGPNENGSDCRNASEVVGGWGVVVLTAYGSDPSLPG